MIDLAVYAVRNKLLLFGVKEIDAFDFAREQQNMFVERLDEFVVKRASGKLAVLVERHAEDCPAVLGNTAAQLAGIRIVHPNGSDFGKLFAWLLGERKLKIA